MSKAVIQLGYSSYVMDLEDAIKVINALMNSERYEAKYIGGEHRYTYHVWTVDEDAKDPTTHMVTMIPDALYRIAKLAGKPDKE